MKEFRFLYPDGNHESWENILKQRNVSGSVFGQESGVYKDDRR